MKVTEVFPSKYLEAADLDGKEFRVIIESVEENHKGDGKDGKPFVKPLLRFRKAKKGLVLCKTSAKVIRDQLGYGNEMQEWVNKPIVLFPTTCTAFGVKDTPCIRIVALRDGGGMG